MKSKIFLLFFVVVMFVLCTFFVSAEIKEYKYYREVNTAGIRVPVYVNLDSNILDYTESDGKDIRVYDGSKELAYHITYENSINPLAIESITASSTQTAFRGTDYSPANMIDDSFDTIYQNNFAVEPAQTTLLVNLGDIKKVNMLQIFYTDDMQNIPQVTVYAYINGVEKYVDSMNSDSISLHDVYTNKLTIVFNHTGTIKIATLGVTGESFGKILFKPVTDKTFIYYGKANDAGIVYDTSNLFTDISTKTLSTSKQSVNILFKGDKDNGIYDNCPSINNPTQIDTDKDGVGDACDNCKFVANKDQSDNDKDGIGDSCDNCPFTINPDQLDKDLDTIGEACDDNDYDQINNLLDNCVNGYNPDQRDTNRDGIGDECDDDDKDSVINYLDLCSSFFDSTNKDTDKDGVGDVCDNCPTVSNYNQKDSDNNGVGDECEDIDKDGALFALDNCPKIANPDQVDYDSDNIGDKCDNCPEVKNYDQNDIDRDGIGDVCDTAESRVLENPTIVWSIMIIAIVIILSGAFFLKNKK